MFCEMALKSPSAFLTTSGFDAATTGQLSGLGDVPRLRPGGGEQLGCPRSRPSGDGVIHLGGSYQRAFGLIPVAAGSVIVV